MLEDDEYKRRMEEALDAAASVGSGSSTLPTDGLDHEALRALVAREQQAEVVPTFGDAAMAREAEAVAPKPAMRKPLVPKQAAPAVGAKVPDEMDAAFAAVSVPPADPMDEARRADVRARNRQRRETAVRQLIAGLTRTQPVAASSLPPSRVEAERARQAQQAQLASVAAGRDLAERRFEYQKGAEGERVKRDTAKLEFDRKRQAALDAQAAEDKVLDRDLRERGVEASMANAAAMQAMARTNLGMRQDEAAAKKTEREQGIPDELRKELNALPEVKQFAGISASFDKMRAAAGNASAAGDLSLIFNFMRMLDPGSAVKEGEFNNAQNATGVLGAVINQYNKLLSGERLSPQQREDFMRQAQSFYDVERQAYDKQVERYRGLATKRGANPDDVITPSAPAATGGTIRVRKGNDVLDIDASDLEAALADKYEVVR